MERQSKHQHVKLTEYQRRKVKTLLLNERLAEVFREKFHEKLPRDGKQLYQALNKHRGLLKALMRSGTLSKTQFNILLPQHQSTDSSLFDVTLTKLLLFSTICGYKRPGKGWKLMPNDHSNEANFIRLERGRNKIQHLGETVEQAELDEIFDLTQPALLDFNITQEEIDRIRYLEIDETLGAKFLNLQKDYTYNFTIPVENFIGRKEKIQEIHDKCVSIETKRDKYAVSICGIAGVGKSETARMYCKKYHEVKYYNKVVWINAESVESIDSCFIDIATDLHIPTHDDQDKKISMKMIVDAVYSFFDVTSGDKTSSRVIFVFDNVKEMKQLKTFLPFSKNSLSIIVTTQNQQWDEKRFDKVHIEVFNEDLAQSFLQKQLLENASKEDCKELLASLGNHPLAIQQAVAYMNLNDVTVFEYLNEYNSNNWSKLAGEDTLNLLDGNSVFKTFSMSVGNLENEEGTEESLKLLKKLAYLNGNLIEKELIKKICGNDNVKTNQCLTMLENYSLITRRKGIENKEQTVTMHSLVQRTIKSLNEGKGESKEYIDCLFKVVQDDFSIKKTGKDRGKLMFNHFIHLYNEGDTKQLVLEKCLDDYFYLILSVVFEDKCQENAFLKICDDILKLDVENEHKIKVNNLKARSLIKIGMYKEGRSILETLLSNELHDEENSLITKANLALCLERMGKYKEALQLYKKLENIEFQVTESTFLILQATIQNMASCLEGMEKYKEALELYKEVKNIKLQVLESTHPSLLTTKHNIASCLKSMGKHKEALELYKEVENIQLQVLESTHPSLLTTKHNIADSLERMGKHKEALELYKEVENIQLQVLESTHPSLLTTKQNIAFCLKSMGKHKEALELYKEVENIQLQVLESTHPSLLATKHNIASFLKSMGKHKEALELYKEVENIQLQVIESTHPSLLTTKNSIASCLHSMGKQKEALELYKEVENIKLQVLESTHPSLLTTKNSIAVCLHSMGKYKEALELYKEVENIQLQVLESTHPTLLATKDNIASCLKSMGKHKEALELYKEVENIQLQVLESTHPSLLTTKHNIADSLERMGKYKEALELYKEVENIQLQVLESTHPSLLTTKHNIASCLHSMGKHKEALELYKEVENIQLQVLESTHPSLLNTKNSIASCLHSMGKYKEALELHKKVENIELQVLESTHPNLLATKHNIAACLERMGKYKEALELYQEVENIQLQVLESTHPNLLTTKKNIAFCLLKIFSAV